MQSMEQIIFLCKQSKDSSIRLQNPLAFVCFETIKAVIQKWQIKANFPFSKRQYIFPGHFELTP